MLRNLCVVIVSCYLVACGGGSDPDAPANMVNETPPTVVSQTTLSGLAVDGPIAGATVTLFNASGTQVGQTTTDAAGRFTIQIPESTTYPVTVRVSGGTDTVTNAPSTLNLAGMALAAGQPILITPFSTLAVRQADSCTVNALQARNAITNSSVSTLLGSIFSFGIDSGVRSQLLSQIPTGLGPASSLLLSSEQFAEVLRRTSAALSGSADERTPDQIMTALACDIGNGTVDGIGTGSSSRLAAMLHLVLAEVMLEAASDQLRSGGSNATNPLNSALERTFGVNATEVSMVTVSTEMLNLLKRLVDAALTAGPDAGLLELYNTLNGLTAPLSTDALATALAGMSDQAPMRDIISLVNTPSTAFLVALAASAPPSAPVISLFTATPSTVGSSAGGVTTLQWSATNASACSRTGPGLGWNGVGNATGTLNNIGPVVLNSTFTLTCTGPGGQTTASVNVLVPPAVSISFSPSTANLNETVTVTITSTNTTSCNATLSGGSAAPASIASGDTFPADVGHQVDASCTGPGGNANAASSLPVRGARLTWDAPTLTETGSGVSLEGFVVYHGTTPKSRTSSITINDANARELTQGFPTGPRYFEITAIANGSLEGRYSEEVFKEIP